MNPIFINKTEEECFDLGLKVIPSFITESEENDIVQRIKQTEYKNGNVRNCVQRFGSNKPYPKDMVSDTIPDYLNCISEKIFNVKLLKSLPDSVSVNEYYPGQGIPHHIDSLQSGDIITVLSLLSHTMLNFKRKKENFDILIPARCLMQMDGIIRNKWKHGIKATNEDVLPETILQRSKRISIVFRCTKEKTTDFSVV